MLWDIEYTLDSEYNDPDFIVGLKTLSFAYAQAEVLKRSYGSRIKKLDIKGFSDGFLEEHIQII